MERQPSSIAHDSQRDLVSRNRLLGIILWVSYALGFAANLTTGATLATMTGYLFVVLPLIIITSIMVWRKWFTSQTMYVMAIIMAIISFTIVIQDQTLSVYLVVFFGMAVISLYHDWRAVLTNVIASILITIYLLTLPNQKIANNPTDIQVVLLMLILVSGALVIQSRLGQRDKAKIISQSEMIDASNREMKQLIMQIANASEQVSTSAQELAASTEETTSASEHVANAIEGISNGSKKQVETVQQGMNAIKDFSRMILEITEYSNHVAEDAKSTSTQATQGAEIIEHAVEQMGRINDHMAQLVEVVTELGDRSENIGQITAVISTISAQTNLLALNAAIEAARAGEAGQGFSVVAGEVRKLAEQSANAAKQIAEYVDGIKTEIQSAITSVQTGTSEVESGLKVVNRAGKIFSDIQNAINRVATQVTEVNQSAVAIHENTTISDSVRLMGTVAEENSAHAETVAGTTEQQMATMQEIAASTAGLSNLAAHLLDVVKSMEKTTVA
ncbi:methyl-accepting chemotaxis protein [Alicyclobacillus sp. SO9]|uniref:methyl-accepting chemotaxis protein n=1 Tax=Alicyclobacillus sp. SO9 TaxID=2665646 RepID=UPI0018E7E1FA|nr:methyl-accepting chemotaxis protein [Alicyclobacillus sp. SO9]